MFGLGTYNVMNGIVLDWLGGTRVTVIVTLVVRLIVGIGWFGLFRKVGKAGWQAFVPVLGPLQAFRLAWDDFAFASIFAGSTFVAWIVSMGIDHPLGTAMLILSVVLWWIMAFLTATAFQTSMFFGLIYASLPWLGSLVFGFVDLGEYHGPWSADPERRKAKGGGRGKARRELDRANRKKRAKDQAKQDSGETSKSATPEATTKKKRAKK